MLVDGWCVLPVFPLRVTGAPQKSFYLLQVTAFLAENYTHFMLEDAMDEAAEAAAVLSDAGE
jgi:hypothetical protein